MNLNDVKNNVAKNLYGMTKDEAVNKNICIQCKNSVTDRIYSNAGHREYQISGLCEFCFDEIFCNSELDDEDIKSMLDEYDDEPAF